MSYCLVFGFEKRAGDKCSGGTENEFIFFADIGMW